VTICSLKQGSYDDISITVNGCQSATGVNVTLTTVPTPAVVVASVVNPSCSGADGSITFNFTNVADGNYTVNFDGGSFGFIAVSSGAGTITGLAQGTYSNIKVDITGCSTSDGVNLELECITPIADDENVTISEDTPVTASAVTGDVDSNGTIIASTIILIDPNDPTHTGNSSTPLVIPGEGTYTVDTNGNVTFTPEPNYNGVSRSYYTEEDNDGNLSNIATTTVTVTPVNDGPIAVDDVESIGSGSTLTATVVTNDTPDPEGDNMAYTVVTGTEPIQTNEGTLTFNPDSRQLSRILMPAVLKDFGLISSLEDLIKRVDQNSDIKFGFYANKNDIRFDQTIEVTIFRIVQEAINNIIKHSNAIEANIQLMVHNKSILLTIEDNG
jgi:hypothetical protein